MELPAPFFSFYSLSLRNKNDTEIYHAIVMKYVVITNTDNRISFTHTHISILHVQCVHVEAAAAVSVSQRDKKVWAAFSQQLSFQISSTDIMASLIRAN